MGRVAARLRGDARAPGDPATAILGREATPERLAAVRENLHLDQSALSQYVHWLGGIVTLDPGTSIVSQKPVTEVLSDAARSTASWLTLVAGLVSIPLSIALGVLMAVRRDGVTDHGFSTAHARAGGAAAVRDRRSGRSCCSPPGLHVVPGACRWCRRAPACGTPRTCSCCRCSRSCSSSSRTSAAMMRGSMIEVLESDYIDDGPAEGHSERRVIWRHAVPNAIAPAIQAVALALAYLAGGIVVIEYVFDYPGIGTALVDARAQPRHADRAVDRDADRGGLRAAQPRRRPGDHPRHAEAADAS